VTAGVLSASALFPLSVTVHRFKVENMRLAPSRGAIARPGKNSTEPSFVTKFTLFFFWGGGGGAYGPSSYIHMPNQSIKCSRKREPQQISSAWNQSK
jgi:hypothetical protein